MPDTKTHRSMVGGMIVGALLLVLALAGCGGNEVPDVVGMSPADAVRTLEDAGYALGDISSVYTNEVPEGFVASTDPPAGTREKEGTKVNIAVNSQFEVEIMVPSVVGMSQSDAEADLAGVRLAAVPVNGYSDTVAVGQVMAQVPVAGSIVASGTPVVIEVSQGASPTTVQVPDVSGQSQDAAAAALEQAGLMSKAYEVYSDTVPQGSVIAQSPSAGASVLAGSEVAIAVSLGKGVGAVTVPSVVGMSESEAVSAMQSAGLKATVYRQYSDTVAAKVVAAQLPSGGTTTAAGAEVAIAVSLGPTADATNIDVPNVVGMTEAEATAALDAEGFVAVPVQWASTATPGTVEAQLPVAGSTAPQGSAVVIVVATSP